jgi:predicted N-acetyltransferase YhbS
MQPLVARLVEVRSMIEHRARLSPADALMAPRSLGNGLVLRWSTPDDVERIAALSSAVFRDKIDDPPNVRNAAWTRDLGSGRHPLTTVDQGVLVEDTNTDQVVASMWLIPTAWTFGSIRFGVGRPESVVSHPNYRRQGLVRALFEAFHARSAANGDLVQAITGIPFYYRQFGYDMALELGGGRSVAFDDIPAVKQGEPEPYHVTAATTGDLPFVMELYERERRRSLVSSDIPEAYWRWMIDGVSSESGEGWTTLLIMDASGERCGFVLARKTRWGKTLGIQQIALRTGVSWPAVIRPVLRALRDHARTVPPSGREPAEPTRLAFTLGTAHPVYAVLGDTFAPRQERPYAWYVRVADVPGFVRHVAPVLEARLRHSPLAGYTGELRLDFYRGGLRLSFADGRLTTAEDWQRPAFDGNPSAGFPPVLFLQVLFGRRSRTELEYVMPDVCRCDEAAMVLDVLFPPQSSLVIPLD